jgi:hypothetical protein
MFSAFDPFEFSYGVKFWRKLRLHVKTKKEHLRHILTPFGRSGIPRWNFSMGSERFRRRQYLGAPYLVTFKRTTIIPPSRTTGVMILADLRFGRNFNFPLGWRFQN